MGWIRLQDWEKLERKRTDDEDDFKPVTHDLWVDDSGEQGSSSKSTLERLRARIPAPKLPPPTHAESYNPPQEYLFSEEEKKKWEETEAEERKQNYEPRKYNCLRHVPGYTRLMAERQERCLDLYLAPRQRKLRVSVYFGEILQLPGH